MMSIRSCDLQPSMPLHMVLGKLILVYMHIRANEELVKLISFEISFV